MPVYKFVGYIETDQLMMMMGEYETMDEATRPQDFDQFFIELAVVGFEEVMKDRQVQRRVQAHREA